MAEWLKAHAWKACLLERVTWARIPLSPPYFHFSNDPSAITISSRICMRKVDWLGVGWLNLLRSIGDSRCGSWGSRPIESSHCVASLDAYRFCNPIRAHLSNCTARTKQLPI